jgi:hypothetical protein
MGPQTRFRRFCSLYITDILISYDAIGGGMASITITFKVGHEIHQPSMFGRYVRGMPAAARARCVVVQQRLNECEPKLRRTL